MPDIADPATSPARFSEEAATEAMRSNPSDLETGVAAIRNTVATLQRVPGVYRMHGTDGGVLYVGKAKALRNRVAAYTQPAGQPRRIQRMIAQTRSMTIVTTASEAQALLLEAQLIKRFRPPYNVLLRDDKSFPFIALDEGHAFPRLYRHRGARQRRTVYYGPFASAGAVMTTLNALQKLFLLRSCTDSYFANRSRPCLLYQLRRCSAPCVGRIEAEGYAELVDDARAFLSGRSQQVQRKLVARMQEAAAARDFELAAIFRDRLRALSTIQGALGVQGESDAIDADVIALASRDGAACVQIYFVRNGQNWGHHTVFPAHVAGVPDDEVLTAFLGQFYADVTPARLLLLDRTLPEAATIAEALSERAGRRVMLAVPQRGRRRRLVEEAERNAREAVERKLAEATTQMRHLEALTATFGLPQVPGRIEIYDNSHVQGSNALGAMVVAGPRGFMKAAYRKFNMKTDGSDHAVTPGDDFAMMRAMLSRRFARLSGEDPDREGTDWPDLLLIDGGKGQVAAAVAALAEHGAADIAVIGIAKGPDRNAGREIFHLADGRELTLAPNDPLLFFLQRLRDEAHRFVIGGHRQKRGKAMLVSALDDIPGIGPARKKALLLHFGSARAVKSSTPDELVQAPGISRTMAETIHAHFNPPR